MSRPLKSRETAEREVRYHASMEKNPKHRFFIAEIAEDVNDEL
jgi:hypothetical protein